MLKLLTFIDKGVNAYFHQMRHLAAYIAKSYINRPGTHKLSGLLKLNIVIVLFVSMVGLLLSLIDPTRLIVSLVLGISLGTYIKAFSEFFVDFVYASWEDRLIQNNNHNNN